MNKNDLNNIFGKSELPTNASSGDLLRSWEELQVDVPELGDIDLSAADFQNAEKLDGVKGGSSNGFFNAMFTILIGGIALTLAWAFWPNKAQKQVTENINQQVKLVEHGHQLQSVSNKFLPPANQFESNGSQVAINKSIQPAQLNQQVKLALTRQESTLVKMEALGLNNLRLHAEKVPNIKKQLYRKDYNYKFMADYKVYDYSYRSISFRDNPNAFSLDPRYSNWTTYRFRPNDEGVAFREYEDLLFKAFKYMEKERYREVDLILFAIIKVYPKDQNAWFYSGISSYRQGKFNEAQSCFQFIIDDELAHVFSQEAHWYKTLCLLKQGENLAAKKELKSIVDANGFYKAHAKDVLENEKL